MNKFLIICGPTGSGKTDLALLVAKRCTGELVSADSRQMYKDFTILSGKDIPTESVFRHSDISVRGKQLGFYETHATRLWLMDVFAVTDRPNVSFYRQAAHVIIRDIDRRKKLPIVTGGTGLYLEALTRHHVYIDVPPNPTLRRELTGRSVADLQTRLSTIDAARFTKMNVSDRLNPQRLIRAIEIAQERSSSRQQKSPQLPQQHPRESLPAHVLWIGLTAPIRVLEERIRVRIRMRIRRGVIDEVKAVVERNGRESLPSLLGLSQILQYLDGKISESELTERWFVKERQYMKRQLTWFRSRLRIRDTWFDTADPGFADRVTSRVAAWYTGSTHGDTG